MPERLKKLGISQKNIDALASHEAVYESNIVDFIKKVYGKIANEQPELYNYTQEITQSSKVEDVLAYSLGVALTYCILPQCHTKNSLTVNEINTMRATIAEHITFKEGNESEVDLSWFTDKLRDDSPVFVDWLEEKVDEIKDADSKATFIFGAVHVLMPFFMREEAKEMDRKFFKED